MCVCVCVCACMYVYVVQLEGNSNLVKLSSVSSDVFLQVKLEVVEQQMWNYGSYVYEEKKINSQAWLKQ